LILSKILQKLSQYKLINIKKMSKVIAKRFFRKYLTP